MGGRSLLSLFCLASLYCSVIPSNVLQHQEINYRGLLAKQTTDKFGLTLREVTEGDRVTQQLYSEAAGRVLACETVHNATAGGLPVSTAGVQAPAVLPQEFAWLNLTSVREDCRLAQAVHTREKRSATRRRTRHGRNKLNKIRKGRKKDRLAKGRKGTMEEIFIVPGTKWCGPRNVAGRYSDMGPAWEADRCCRVHDQCQRSIMALSKGFNNVNYQPFTVSHCSCDRRKQPELLRVPGTKWCGRGYDATSYRQLGAFAAADRCCRHHDTACPHWIPAMSYRWGLYNWRPSTLMHCHCDRRNRQTSPGERSEPRPVTDSSLTSSRDIPDERSKSRTVLRAKTDD